jgi:hypothetical protein
MRRSDLEAFRAVLDQLDGAGAVVVTGWEELAAAGAVGLAAAAAAGGARAALLECDPARPLLAGALGLAERPGLREYLLGEAESAHVLQPLVLAGPAAAGAAEPLVCVVAGGGLDGRGDLLASGRFAEAVAGLRDAYELLVLGGPPLERGVDVLRQVAAHADVTLACAERSELRGASARRLRRALRPVPGRLGGFIAFEEAQRS